MIYSVMRKPTSLSGSQLYGWSNYNNLLSTDGLTATSQLTAQNTNTPYLKFSEYDNPIPDDAIVVGVKLHVTGRNQYASNTGFGAVGASAATGSGGIRLLGTMGTVGRGMTAFTRNTLTTKELGSESDLWGASSIPTADVNSPSFGVFASFRNAQTTSQSMFLDCIELEVFYTMPEGSPEPYTGGGSLPPKNL